MGDGLRRARAAALATQDPERDVAAKLAAWIDEQGITALDSTEALAGRVIASLGAAYVAERLASGATDYLRATAEAYTNPAPLDDAGLAAELFWHGHDPY